MACPADYGTPEYRQPQQVPGRTALVLSAGGLYGAYQAGVWSVLSRIFQPDLVIGASIGALNGWLIASGCSPEDLQQRWLNFDRGSRPKWRFPRYLSEGFVDTDPVEQWIREIHASGQPRVDYAAVATELRRMRPKLFRFPQVSWRHLMASCAVPLVLRQHLIDGVFYGDGGLLDPMPAWAAAELGATRIIGVNLLPFRPKLIRAVVRCARAYGRYSPHALDDTRLVTIQPSEPLGGPADTMYWNRHNAERWIEQGQKDAHRLEHLVVECFERK